MIFWPNMNTNIFGKSNLWYSYSNIQYSETNIWISENIWIFGLYKRQFLPEYEYEYIRKVTFPILVFKYPIFVDKSSWFSTNIKRSDYFIVIIKKSKIDTKKLSINFKMHEYCKFMTILHQLSSWLAIMCWWLENAHITTFTFRDYQKQIIDIHLWTNYWPNKSQFLPDSFAGQKDKRQKYQWKCNPLD